MTDKEGLAAIIETRSRINAIALVHRGLYESADLRYVDMQTPVALFIVEAITNAAKHGVSKGGHIDAVITQTNENVQVSVSDNGDQNIKKSKPKSKGIGTKLMNGFARQLSGKLTISQNDEGYNVSLNFTPRSQ